MRGSVLLGHYQDSRHLGTLRTAPALSAQDAQRDWYEADAHARTTGALFVLCRYSADILGDLARLSLADPEVQAPDLAREPDLASEPDLAAAPEVLFEEVAAKPHKWQARCTQLPS